MSNSSLDGVRRRISRLRARGAKWREVGEAYPGVPLGTLSRFTNDPDYVPHKRAILRALGLPPLALVPVCPDCGKPPGHRHLCGDRFERNAKLYDAWLAANAATLAAMVAAAEAME